MSTIRTKKKYNPFVQIDKQALQDETLSWKAKGLLSYLLSLPDDWKVYVSDLANRSKDGRDSTRSAIDELIKAGYIEREKAHNSDGTFAGYNYTVHEEPQRVNRVGKSENGLSENGLSENGKPVTTNNNNTNNNNTKNKDTWGETPQAQVSSKVSKKKRTPKQEKEIEAAKIVLNKLNDLAEKNYATDPDGKGKYNGSKNISKVVSLLRDKYELEDILLTVEFKCWEWKGNPKMEKNLCPDTIFGGKFRTKYLHDALLAKENPKFAKVLQKAKKAEQGIDTSVSSIPSDVVDAISNW